MGRTGIRISFFTSLLVAGASCGSVKDSGVVDAGPSDGGADADETGMATIVTEAALFGGTIGANVGNIDIVSMLPNNTVLETSKTDAGGNASVKVYPGGSVTAIYKHTADMGADLITFVGVKPSDTLTFGSRNFLTPSGVANPVIGAMTHNMPTLAGATQYYAFTACTFNSNSTPSVAVSESMLCHKEPMDVLYLAHNGTNVIGFGFRPNVTFTNGGTTTLSGFQAVGSMMTSITGLPTEANQLSGVVSTVLDSSIEWNVFGNFGRFNGQPTGGAFTNSVPWAPTGERTTAQLTLQRCDMPPNFCQGGYQPIRLFDSLAATATTWTIASPQLPPWIQNNTVVSGALKMANWFIVEGSSSVHDAVVLRVSWSVNMAGVFQPHQWFFVLPPKTMALVFPKLPSQFADQMPHPTDSLSAQVRLLEIPTISNYDGIRALPARNITCPECAIRAGEIPRVMISGN